jgi:hypothetical protein
MRRVLRPMRPDEVDTSLRSSRRVQWPPSDISFPRTHTHSRALRCSNVGRTSSLGQTSSASSSKDPMRCGRFRSDQWQPIAALRNRQVNVGIRTCWTGPRRGSRLPSRTGTLSGMAIGVGAERPRMTFLRKARLGADRPEPTIRFPPHPILLGYERDLTERVSACGGATAGRRER